MLAHIFRPTQFVPYPITSIASNPTIVAVFRRNGMLDLLSSKSYIKYLSFELFECVIQSFFIDLTTVLCLTENGKIILLNTKNLSKIILNLDATAIFSTFTPVDHCSVLFYFSNIKNELFLYKNNDKCIIKIANFTSKITTLYELAGNLLIGTNDGWITVLNNGNIITEINLGTSPKKIAAHMNLNVFCVCCENGYLYLISSSSEIILDSFKVRDSSLNDLILENGNIFTSGIDSRIFHGKIIDNKIVKITQGDPHVSDVLCMCLNRNDILSGGEDCSLVITNVDQNKLIFRSVYDSSILAGKTKDYFYVTTEKTLDLYSIDKDKYCDINHDSDSNILAPKIISEFDIDRTVLHNLNQRVTNFTHFLSIQQSNRIISADIHYNQQYACISTSKKTILYTLFSGSSLHIESINEYPPSKWVKFSNNFLVMQHLDFTITILDLSSFNIKKLEFTDLRENIMISDKYLINIEKCEIYNLRDDIKSKIQVEFPKDLMYILVKPAIVGIESISYYFVCEKSCSKIEVIDPKNIVIISKENTELIKHVAGNCIYSSDDNLYLIRHNSVFKYEIGPLIHQIVSYDEDVIVVQTSIKAMSKYFKKGIFKEKYSN